MYKEAWSITWEELKAADKDTLSDKEEMFLDCQEVMHNEGGTWFMRGGKDEDDNKLDTFKSLMHYISGDDLDDEEWLKETIAPVTPEVGPAPQAPVEQPVMQQPVDDEGYDPNMDTYDQYQTESVMPAPQAPATGFQGATQGTPVPPQTQQPVAPQQPAYNGNPGAIATNAPVAPQPPAGAHGQPNGVDTSAQVGANAFPATTMDSATFQRVVYNLYGKIYNQIFNSCGFNPTHGEGQPFFMQGGKVTEMIELTPEEQTIVHGMECYDEHGRIKMNAKVDNWISGRFIDKAQKLPGFSLVMSDMNGRQIRRKFIPQNPWNKDNNGAYKKTALLAQQGTWIMWIVDPDATDKQFATRIMAGKLETNIGGKWQEVVIS
jgi:hypothetical protein